MWIVTPLKCAIMPDDRELINFDPCWYRSGAVLWSVFRWMDNGKMIARAGFDNFCQPDTIKCQ